MTRTRRVRRSATAITTVLGIAAVAVASAAIPVRALDRKVTRKVQPASVQLGPIYTMKDEETGEDVMRVLGWGSGTIIDANGDILTNAHVTDVGSVKEEWAKDGATVMDGYVAVFMTKRSDEPAIPVFMAKILAEDTTIDLAIVRIVSDFGGRKVDLKTTNLPWVPLGDSDEVELGDTLNVFGYPGIGGETITYTSGPVSGFASDKNVKGRAWIKTSTSISGGNSGGTGVDDSGALIGVPTRTGVVGASGYVDCRQLADTNRDGEIDDKDTCVPTGGFLNSLRAINVGKALIAKATRLDTVPDTDVPDTPDDPDADTPDNEVPGGDTEAPDTEAPDTEAPETTPETTPPTTAPPAKPKKAATTAKTVRVTGRMLDASTGKPVVGAYYFVLKPGLTWSTISGDPDEDLFGSAVTDRNGYFELATPLVRGQRYSMAASATKQGYTVVREDAVLVPSSGDDPLQLELRLERA